MSDLSYGANNAWTYWRARAQHRDHYDDKQVANITYAIALMNRVAVSEKPKGSE